MIDLQAVNTIHDLMDAAADACGSRPAIEDENITLSYYELNELRLKAASLLLAMGVEPGDRVAIWAPNIHEWVMLKHTFNPLPIILLISRFHFNNSDPLNIVLWCIINFNTSAISDYKIEH